MLKSCENFRRCLKLTSELRSLLLVSTFSFGLVLAATLEISASVLEDVDGASDKVGPPSVNALPEDASLTGAGFCVANAAVNSVAAVSCHSL
jgi:hypothetical protein